MESNGQHGGSREKLLDDLRLVMHDAEELLRTTGQQMDEGYQVARARFESTLSDAKTSLSALEQQVVTGARDALETTDQYVKSNPWQSVGIGALAGLVVGLWFGRR